MSRLVRAAIAVPIVIVGTLWWRSNKTSDASAEILAESRALIAQVEGYAANPAYFDELVGRAHDVAFPGNYDPGSPRRRFSSGQAESFKEDRYVTALFVHIRKLAYDDLDTLRGDQARQIKDFLTNLEKLRQEMGVPER